MPMVLNGRYLLGDLLGAGGSSNVYLGHDELLDRPVAVKLLDEAAARSADPAARRRFVEESRTAATFAHPNAVMVLDAGADQGSLFLVMEFVAGGSLAAHLATSGPMSPDSVSKLGSDLASALGAAHAAGIIHRDVKPSNVLLDGDGNAKLADFGIARRFEEIEDSLTATGMVMGTRQYVSPEQAAGRPLGPTTDVFSLGLTMFEAATGRRAASSIERAPDNRLDIRQDRPEFDATLADIISRATALPVDTRYASASELGAALAGTAPVGSPPTAAPAAGRVDETETMPAHLRPDRSPTAIASTTAATARDDGNHGVGVPPEMVSDIRNRRHRRQVFWLAAIAAVALLGGLFVLAARRDDSTTDLDDPGPVAESTLDGDAPVGDTRIDDAIETAPPSAAPTTGAGATGATIEPATTGAAAEPTAAEITTTEPAPTTEAPPPQALDEVIAGFPVPADRDEFVQLLSAENDGVGARGTDLANDLAKLFEKTSDPKTKAIDKLRESIDEWTGDGELNPAIADVARSYLDAAEPDDQSDDED